MRKQRNRYDEEFKRNVVKLSHASLAETAALAEEVKKLRLESAELKIERDMLKKPRPTLQSNKSEI